jgi:hypothetical protein
MLTSSVITVTRVMEMHVLVQDRQLIIACWMFLLMANVAEVVYYPCEMQLHFQNQCMLVLLASCSATEHGYVNKGCATIHLVHAYESIH